jgi:DNA-binding Xre family transcriptional regulator
MGEKRVFQRGFCLDFNAIRHRLFTQLFWLRVLEAVGENFTHMTIAKVELLRLGRRIKASRQMLGRKQKDFCERCGLERTHFDEIERGERNVTFSNLCQICEGLNCDIAAVTEGIPHPADAPKQAK